MSLKSLFSADKTGNALKIFVIILVVNILQSVFSPLLWDESYYWVWARDLSWGYYDHPPMVSFLVRMGMDIFPGEFGVRAFCMLLGSLTYYFICLIIEGETNKPIDLKLGALLLFSSLFLNLFSFFACPDTPMVFFAVLFFYTYRRYLQNETLLNTVLVGVVTALLLYSKYQGVLVIGFTVLSNIKILTRRSFYLAVLVAIVLFIPHIYWQIQNDYPTIRFHLAERAKIISWHDYNYVPKQLLFTGPVILLLFSFIYKTKSKLQLALKVNAIGIFLFFFYSSLHNLVYTHWTLIAWPAMLCLTYFYIDNLKRYKAYIYVLLALNLVLVIAIRVNFIFDFYKMDVYNDQNPELMSSIIKERSKGHSVVFLNMFNEPASYMYYSHDNAYATSNVRYKKTQFNYLPYLEKQVQNKTISLISEYAINTSSQKLNIPMGKEYYITFIPNFTSFTGVEVTAANFKSLKQGVENVIQLSIDSKLDSADNHLFKQRKGYLAFNLMSRDIESDSVFTYRYDKVFDPETKKVNFKYLPKLRKGHYRCNFSVMTDDNLLTGFNSYTYNIDIN